MYKKIMVPLDGSELAECVFPHIRSFIDTGHAGEFVFVRVVDPVVQAFSGPYVTGSYLTERMRKLSKQIEEERKAKAADYLERAAKQFELPGASIHTVTLVGDPANSLVEYAEAGEVDLILIASHGRSGISRWIRGSVADRILHAAKVPVLIVGACDAVQMIKKVA